MFFTRVNKYSQATTDAVDIRHLKSKLQSKIFVVVPTL